MKQSISNMELLNAINQSGFPFEIKIANRIIDLGFDVSPSHHFFDNVRQRDLELDMRAVRNFEFTSAKGKKITVNLQIALECKDTASSYVCFSLHDKLKSPEGIVDKDIFRFHIGTSKDIGIPNRFSTVLFSGSKDNDNIKAKLHQFDGDFRHYMITQIDGKRLHIPDKLNSTLMKIASYISMNDTNLKEINKHGILIEDIYGISIFIIFSMLVHTGPHYRYSVQDGSLTESYLTPVFLSYGFPDKSVSFIMDLVSESEVETAIAHIAKDVELIVQQIYKYVAAS